MSLTTSPTVNASFLFVNLLILIYFPNTWPFPELLNRNLIYFTQFVYDPPFFRREQEGVVCLTCLALYLPFLHSTSTLFLDYLFYLQLNCFLYFCYFPDLLVASSSEGFILWSFSPLFTPSVTLVTIFDVYFCLLQVTTSSIAKNKISLVRRGARTGVPIVPLNSDRITSHLLNGTEAFPAQSYENRRI